MSCWSSRGLSALRSRRGTWCRWCRSQLSHQNTTITSVLQLAECSYQNPAVATESVEKQSPQLLPTHTVGSDGTHVAGPYVLHPEWERISGREFFNFDSWTLRCSPETGENITFKEDNQIVSSLVDDLAKRRHSGFIHSLLGTRHFSSDPCSDSKHLHYSSQTNDRTIEQGGDRGWNELEPCWQVQRRSQRREGEKNLSPCFNAKELPDRKPMASCTFGHSLFISI